MTDFCIEKLTPVNILRHEHGVLKQASVTVTADAVVAAQTIISNAQVEAEAIVANAYEEARHIAERIEQDTLTRAQVLLQRLDGIHAEFIDRSQDMVVDLAQGLFDRLIIDLTPRKKIEAALKRILREAPPRLVTPLLRVHPEDLPLVTDVEWEIKADLSLGRGTCRLETTNGEWCVDFDAGVIALKAALEKERVVFS